MDLAKQVNMLKSGRLRKTIDKRLGEFRSFRRKSEDEWFSELCFCILTANSKAKTAISIQEEIGAEGFACISRRGLVACIKNHKHRFHNNKARFIMDARKFFPIKKTISLMADKEGVVKTRKWIVENIKGIGYKEASHFLRNVGYDGIAILDRHIINLMAENEYIKRPKSMTPKTYMEIEKKYLRLAHTSGMAPVELDLYMWYLKTGEVLK